jgi:hypothetical protein
VCVGTSASPGNSHLTFLLVSHAGFSFKIGFLGPLFNFPTPKIIPAKGLGQEGVQQTYLKVGAHQRKHHLIAMQNSPSRPPMGVQFLCTLRTFCTHTLQPLE